MPLHLRLKLPVPAPAPPPAPPAALAGQLRSSSAASSLRLTIWKSRMPAFGKRAKTGVEGALTQGRAARPCGPKVAPRTGGGHQRCVSDAHRQPCGAAVPLDHLPRVEDGAHLVGALLLFDPVERRAAAHLPTSGETHAPHGTRCAQKHHRQPQRHRSRGAAQRKGEGARAGFVRVMARTGSCTSVMGLPMSIVASTSRRQLRETK